MATPGRNPPAGHATDPEINMPDIHLPPGVGGQLGQPTAPAFSGDERDKFRDAAAMATAANTKDAASSLREIANMIRIVAQNTSLMVQAFSRMGVLEFDQKGRLIMDDDEDASSVPPADAENAPE